MRKRCCIVFVSLVTPFALLLLISCGGGGGGGTDPVPTAVDYPVAAASGASIIYTSPDNPNIVASLSVPPGALAADTTITVDVSDAISDSNVIPGLGFQFLPDGLSFAQSVTFVVTYDEAALPVGVDESELKIHRWTGSGWQEYPSVVDTVANTVTTQLSGFSWWHVFPRTPSPPGEKTWTHPAGVSDAFATSIVNAGGGSFQVQAEMADNGEAVVVWLSGVGYTNNDRVFMTEYRGGAWTHHSGPIPHDGYISLEPRSGYASQIFDMDLDVNESGETIIAYNQLDAAGTAAWRVYQSYYNGTAWNHPSYLQTDAMSAIGPYASRPDAYYPAAAMDGSGDAILVWHMKDASNYDRFYKREFRDGFWSAMPDPATDALNPSTTAGTFSPVDAAANENGDAVLLWQESGGLRVMHYRDAGSGHAWSSTVATLDMYPGIDRANMKVLMANNGDIAILVKDPYDLYVSEKRSGGDWTTPRALNDESSFVASFSAAMDNAGNTLVVWQQPGGGIDQIYTREYDAAAGTWSPVPDVTLDAISPQPAPVGTFQKFANPSVAVDGNGDAVIAFTGSYSGTGVCGEGPYQGYCEQIFVTQRAGGGQWTHETGTAEVISPSISTLDYSVNRKPVAAMDGAGNAVVVWDQNDEGGNVYLFMSEYR